MANPRLMTMRSPKVGLVPTPKKPTTKTKTPAKRGRGRPQHVVTEETTATVMRLIAIGHPNDEVAAAIGVTHETLNKHYGPVLKTAKMVIRAAMVNAIFKSAISGNVSAQKKVIEMTGDDQQYRIPDAPAVVAEPAAPKAKPLGKKEEALIAAANPDTSTSMGALMAARNGDTTAH